MKLSEEAEEVATFYSKMLEHDYTTKEVFNNNFLKDWRKVRTADEPFRPLLLGLLTALPKMGSWRNRFVGSF